MSKPTVRASNIQQTAAPVSGKKLPQSRCALSRCAEKLDKEYNNERKTIFPLFCIVTRYGGA